MVDNKVLTEYYFNTDDEFPLEFLLDTESPRKWVAQTKYTEIYIGRFTIHDEFITASVETLGQTSAFHLDTKSKEYGFEYDFDNPKDVLSAFVDVSYQVILEAKAYLQKIMDSYVADM